MVDRRPGKEADILVIVAADDPNDLKQMVSLVVGRSENDGLKLLFEQRGEALPRAAARARALRVQRRRVAAWRPRAGFRSPD